MQSNSALKKIETSEPILFALKEVTPQPAADPAAQSLRALRWALGLGLIFSFSILLIARPVPDGSLTLFGFHLTQLHAPDSIVAMGHPEILSGVICGVGLALSLALCLGIWTATAAGALFVLHSLFHLQNAVFGWDPVLDPLLICMMLTPLPQMSSARVLRLAQIVCGVAIAIIAWSQVEAAPWITPRMLSRYIARSRSPPCWQSRTGFFH